ncbi:MAG: hypothetical protein KDB23_29285, partial [Planctomycetales bacterium]|nr:hypothetical protein [Planctomycetales bacterium]
MRLLPQQLLLAAVVATHVYRGAVVLHLASNDAPTSVDCALEPNPGTVRTAAGAYRRTRTRGWRLSANYDARLGVYWRT